MAKLVRKGKNSLERQRLIDEVSQLKRERILAEAADLFYENGYQGTSVEAIADRLGVTKPFVYYHFESKSDILSEICQRGTRLALSIAERAFSNPGNPIERLRQFVHDFTLSSLDNQKYVMIYFRESMNLSRVDAEQIHRMRKDIDRYVLKLLEEGNEAGEFAIDEPAVAALAITGMASFPVAWYRKDAKIDKEHFCDAITELAMRMAANSDPAQIIGNRQVI